MHSATWFIPPRRTFSMMMPLVTTYIYGFVAKEKEEEEEEKHLMHHIFGLNFLNWKENNKCASAWKLL